MTDESFMEWLRENMEGWCLELSREDLVNLVWLSELDEHFDLREAFKGIIKPNEPRSFCAEDPSQTMKSKEGGDHQRTQKH